MYSQTHVDRLAPSLLQLVRCPGSHRSSFPRAVVRYFPHSPLKRRYYDRVATAKRGNRPYSVKPRYHALRHVEVAGIGTAWRLKDLSINFCCLTYPGHVRFTNAIHEISFTTSTTGRLECPFSPHLEKDPLTMYEPRFQELSGLIPL